MKKEVIIFFPEDHVAYSPTVLSLREELSPFFKIRIIAPLKKTYEHEDIENVEIEYFEYKNLTIPQKVWLLFTFFLQYINVFSSNKLSYEQLKKCYRFEKVVRKEKNNIEGKSIIAADFIFLYLACKHLKDVNLLSLEINDKDFTFFRKTNLNNIASVIIQSEVRYKHIFGNKKMKTFIVQNAPTFVAPKTPAKKLTKLIYNGHVSKELGFYHCADFLLKYSDFSMDVRGITPPDQLEIIQHKYASLIENNRLNIIEGYIKKEELFAFVSQYEIGFCFYELENIPNRFNYETAPSGKMFTYFASGVPIIGSNIQGLQIVEDFNAGILLDNPSEENIYNAVMKIRSNYDYYKNNCFKAAEHFSFKKNIKPLIEFLSN